MFHGHCNQINNSWNHWIIAIHHEQMYLPFGGVVKVITLSVWSPYILSFP